MLQHMDIVADTPRVSLYMCIRELYTICTYSTCSFRKLVLSQLFIYIHREFACLFFLHTETQRNESRERATILAEM